METILNGAAASYTQAGARTSLWTNFVNYCGRQEENRLMWVGIVLAAHGCILTPMVVMLTLMTGPHFFLFMTAMVAMGMVLVTNLAAMPTKITIPAFAVSLFIDLAIAVACIVSLTY